MIVWDPPGYGNSRPPERDFTPGYLERDADLIVKLLEVCYTSIISTLFIFEKDNRIILVLLILKNLENLLFLLTKTSN